jgi:hypothetical protein
MAEQENHPISLSPGEAKLARPAEPTIPLVRIADLGQGEFRWLFYAIARLVSSDGFQEPGLALGHLDQSRLFLLERGPVEQSDRDPADDQGDERHNEDQ